MLIMNAPLGYNWSTFLKNMLKYLVDEHGTWTMDIIKWIEKGGIVVKKARHSKKDNNHKAKLLFEKIHEM